MSGPKTKNLGPCAFEGCNRDSIARELCYGHWRQQHRGQELRPLIEYKKYAAPAPGKKICTDCERVLDASEDFYKRTNGTPHSKCKKCLLVRSKAWRAKQDAGGTQ